MRVTPRSGSVVLAFGTALLVIAAAGCLPAGSRGTPSDGAAGRASGVAPVATAGASAAAAASGNASHGPASFVPPTPTPAPTFLVVTVAKGDSLNTIAHKYGTSGRSIAYWNRSTHPSLDPDSPAYKPGLIKVGWTLYVIPNVVVDEDTLEPVATEEPATP